jgi:hypothetical protein
LEGDVSKEGKTLAQRAYQEFKEFVVIVLYLWIVLGLFLLYKSVLLNQEHISFFDKGFAIINALVLGKIVLIARALHLGDSTNRYPLVYPTVIKSALFSVVLALFKIFEAGVVAWYHHEAFRAAITDFGGGTIKGILTLTVLMFFVLIPFFGFTELQRVLGEAKLSGIFFGGRESTKQAQVESKV